MPWQLYYMYTDYDCLTFSFFVYQWHCHWGT